jgi:4-hydroxybenzoate polyprenyltransferase
MVLNDICDIEADRINSPERPLVKGIIKKNEAIAISLALSGITEIINVVYLPRHLRWIIHTALLYIHLYTPVMKRIPVIKNISCAFLVAFSLIFSGLSAYPFVPFFENPNRGILYVVANAIFGGSWTNEILLDIRDEEGDRTNHIRTLATLYGKQTAWTIAYILLYVNMLMNMVMIMKELIRTGVHPFLYMGVMVPQFYMLQIIRWSNFSNGSIQSYLNHTTKTMVVILIIFSRSVVSSF